MPPKKWMITAPGADWRVLASLQKKQYARRTPRPGPGLASSMYMMERPVASACAMPMGVKMPWLMALLRKSTLAGSMKMASSGMRPHCMRICTPPMSTARMVVMIGPMAM